MNRSQMVRLVAGICVAPVSWTVQMLVSEPLVAQSCFPAMAPRTSPLWYGFTPALAALSVVCLVAAMGGAWAAWSVWRGNRDPAGHASAVARGTHPVGFLALLGMMGSALFVGAIVFTSLAVILVAPCGKAG
jgi:hypothetical protein